MALNSRSRPPHLRADALAPGTVVYFFKQPGQNKRLQDFATGYHGPAVVACADGPQRLWLQFKGTVVRVAIENVRLATPEEEVSNSYVSDAMKVLEQELTAGRRPAGYEDLVEDEQESSGPSACPDVAGSAGAVGIGAPGSAEEAPSCPPEATVLPPEVRAQAEASAEACRRLDGLPPSKTRSGPYDPPVAPSVSQTISFFEQGGKDENWGSILEDAKERPATDSGLQRFALEKDVRHLEAQVQLGAEEGRRQRDEGGEPLLKVSRVDGSADATVSEQFGMESGVSSLAPRVAEAKMALEAWALSLPTNPAEVERMKKTIEDFDADVA